eukprot:IDg1183t1
MKHSKRVIRYARCTASIGILNTAEGALSPSSMLASVDSDSFGDKDTRHSTTGFEVSDHEAPVYWRSKRQTLVAISSAEAEYVAMSACAHDLTWIRKLFLEIFQQEPWSKSIMFEPTIMELDSTSAIALTSNCDNSNRTKHIILKHHHVRYLIDRGIISIRYILGKDNKSDLLTKIMDCNTLCYLRALLNLA